MGKVIYISDYLAKKGKETWYDYIEREYKVEFDLTLDQLRDFMNDLSEKSTMTQLEDGTWEIEDGGRETD